MLRHRVLDFLMEEQSIRETRQRVVVRQMVNLSLSPFELTNVGVEDRRATIRCSVLGDQHAMVSGKLMLKDAVEFTVML